MGLITRNPLLDWNLFCIFYLYMWDFFLFFFFLIMSSAWGGIPEEGRGAYVRRLALVAPQTLFGQTAFGVGG